MAAEGAAACSDVRLCGYLRKQKSQHRRYFVLRGAGAGGPARLECYESEKKFCAGGAAPRPKKAFPLAEALSISKRADARHGHLLVLCGRDGTWGVAAQSAEQQQAWYAALVELHGKGKASSDGDGESVLSGPAIKEAWQVSLRPRGLGHTRNLAGAYLLCLTDKTISFVKLNTDVAAVVLQLLNVRRCGHSENYFFMEVGRSAVTGPGELWMQVDDLVVAQNMHETILEAMKALSEEFRIRSKSQSLASTPISVPARHQHLGTPPPSRATFPWRPRPEGPPASSRSPVPPRQQVAGLQKPGFVSDHSTVSSDEGGSSPGDLHSLNAPGRPSCLGSEGELDYISMDKLGGHSLAKWRLEANKRASLPPMPLEKDMPGLPQRKLTLKPGAASTSYPEGLDRSADPGYMGMLPGVTRSVEEPGYVPMTPGSVSPPQESGGYMLMSPSGSCSPEGLGPWGPGSGGCESSASDYMNMSPTSRSASSTPPEYSPLLPPPGGTPFFSLPRSYKHGARPFPFLFNPGRLSGSSSTSSESLEESAGTSCSACPPTRLLVGGRGTPAAPRSSGEYVSITCGSRAPGCLHVELQAIPAEASGMAVPTGDAAMAPGTCLVRADAQGRRCHGAETFPDAEWNGAPPCEAKTEPGLNYIDLDLVKEAGGEGASAPRLAAAATPGQGEPPHTYASIDFQGLRELRGCKPSPERAAVHARCAGRALGVCAQGSFALGASLSTRSGAEAGFEQGHEKSLDVKTQTSFCETKGAVRERDEWWGGLLGTRPPRKGAAASASLVCQEERGSKQCQRGEQRPWETGLLEQPLPGSTTGRLEELACRSSSWDRMKGGQGGWTSVRPGERPACGHGPMQAGPLEATVWGGSVCGVVLQQSGEALGMLLEVSPLPLSSLCYVYWVILTALALLLFTLALLAVRRAFRPRELSVTKPSQQGDPEAALVDALHLLDAVMQKTWRRLQQLERRQGEIRNPDRSWS
uniref:insulin receptor substrate 1-like n=1 Tax=Euleptes europaea TaxID=460621 RepID=UPI0025414FB7|nr:insulin receptor substrate 1-like [Euleptes europaea]